MRKAGRALIVAIGALALWQALIALTALPPFILPSPLAVARAFQTHAGPILDHAATTLAEILLGLVVGVAGGVGAALTLAGFRAARVWLLPALIASQAVPVFALAPILVLWLGYGMASKVAVAALVIFFPVASAFYDGLARVEQGWIDLARVMEARPLALLLRVRLPAALPALGSGLRVAAAVAPIGAIIGEWVGASAGLGHLMLHANSRFETDLMIACLITLIVLALLLYGLVDRLATRLTPWVPSNLSSLD